MKVKPMFNPREVEAYNLEQSVKQFLAKGNVIESVPQGVSGINASYKAKLSTFQLHQQVERARHAPKLRKYADTGITLKAAATVMRIKLQRAQMIARENGIVFSDD